MFKMGSGGNGCLPGGIVAEGMGPREGLGAWVLGEWGKSGHGNREQCNEGLCNEGQGKGDVVMRA